MKWLKTLYLKYQLECAKRGLERQGKFIEEKRAEFFDSLKGRSEMVRRVARAEVDLTCHTADLKADEQARAHQRLAKSDWRYLYPWE